MLRHFLKSQRAAIWYALLVIGLPTVTLMILGLLMLWQNNWLIFVGAIWLAVTLTGYAIYRFWPTVLHDNRAANSPMANNSPTNEADTSDPFKENLNADLPIRLEPRPDWTNLDRRVWLRSLESVELALEQQPQWTELPELSLTMLTAVSESYAIENKLLTDKTSAETSGKPDEMYSFTLPEVLLVLSITSARYRQLVLDYIPFADKIKVSSLLSLYARQDQIKTSARWVNNIRRTTRFINPLAAVTAELRDQLTNRIFTNLSDKVQIDLKRLLLQELVQVGMDLYSGRLKSTLEELSDFRSQHYTQDTDDRAIPVEPLRIVLVGQVSSGKSSLVNALINRLDAETDILPSTDSSTVHTLQWPSSESNKHESQILPEPIHIIDTVGLDDGLDSMDSLVAIAQNADLLIWVARANQPARAPDLALFKALQTAFDNQPMRRPAPILLVLTHIDQLKPKAIWQPPYDLNSDVVKALSIRQAIDSCKNQIGLPDITPVVPVSLATNLSTYNLDMVEAQILMLQADATQTQLNRRRTEHNSASNTWLDRWNQASKLGVVSGKMLVRSVIGH